MSTLGVFRDDFYNAISILAQSQFTKVTTAQVGTIMPANQMCGAGDCYIVYSGQTVAQSETTDTAVNIIAALNNAVAVAVAASQANGGGFATGLGVPQGMPNLFNVSWTLTIVNDNLTAGTLTLTAGTGVTFATAGGAGMTANVIVFTAAINLPTVAVYVMQVTSPTTVLMTRVE